MTQPISTYPFPAYKGTEPFIFVIFHSANFIFLEIKNKKKNPAENENPLFIFIFKIK